MISGQLKITLHLLRTSLLASIQSLLNYKNKKPYIARLQIILRAGNNLNVLRCSGLENRLFGASTPCHKWWMVRTPREANSP